MEQEFAETLTRLPRDQMVRIRKARGRCVVVFHGMAWVTQEGDPRDRLLVSGESFTFEHAGVALIHALEPTALVVLERDATAAVSAVEDLPVPVPAMRRLTTEHVYRRARRLRAIAFARLAQRAVSYVRSGWTRLSGAVTPHSGKPARVLQARTSQVG